jgi:hypothetical protein
MTDKELDRKSAQVKNIIQGLSPEEINLVFIRAQMPKGGFKPSDLGLEEPKIRKKKKSKQPTESNDGDDGWYEPPGFYN